MSLTPSIPAEQADSRHAADTEKLAKQLSNPVADLVSIPFQLNRENGAGAKDDLRFVLNAQPVVPFSISEDGNPIGRFILPCTRQPAELVPGSQSATGTGDIVASAFFSPKKGVLIWGVGPVFGLSTTTDPLLGSGKWSIRPTAVVAKQSGRWTLGALANICGRSRTRMTWNGATSARLSSNRSCPTRREQP